MIGFVIGNGESRIGFDLNQLTEFGQIYGCNALYRDFIPDVLVAVDERMVKEIKEKVDLGELVLNDFIYRVKRGPDGVKILQSTVTGAYSDRGYAAGPSAIKILCERNVDLKEVYLVGFDIFSVTGKRNNVYKGTPCYANADAQPVYPTNWIEKLARIFVQYDRIKFYRVTNVDANPPEWYDVDNISNISFDQMMSKLKGGNNGN